MNAIRYAAAFALVVEDSETSLTTDVILNLAELVGVTMETQRAIAEESGFDFWPIAGAEAAGFFMNSNNAPKGPANSRVWAKYTADLVATAINAGLITGVS